MSAPQNLFQTLSSFKIPDESGNSAESRLLAYCTDALGSVERFHFDYKEKRDRRNPILDDDDKKNLAKAVSGFANSGGGVLVWGVKDGSLKPKPISNVQKFLSNLLQLSSQATTPAVEGIDGEWIESETNSEDGFALLYIPESQLPPHRVILNLNDIKDHYYFRTADSFLIASHTQLEDMFGRRPRPKLGLYVDLNLAGGSISEKFVKVVFGIENKGRSIAKSPYFSTRFLKPHTHSTFYNLGLTQIRGQSSDGWARFGIPADPVIHPGSFLTVVQVTVRVFLDKPLSEIAPLEIEYQIGAEDVQLIEGRKTVGSFEIWAIAISE